VQSNRAVQIINGARLPHAATSTYGNFARGSLGAGAALNDALAFAPDNAWNSDVSAAAVEPNSDAPIASMGLTTGLHRGFGSGLYNGSLLGIPYVVVTGTQPRVVMNWLAYASESGAPDELWHNHSLVSERRQVQGSHFEGLRMGRRVAG
jgi:hypothetical protein